MADIEIDPDACMASEMCVSSFPEHVGFDDARGVAVPRETDADIAEETVEELVGLCPAAAIRRTE